MLLRYTIKTVVFYNLYATNTHRHIGPNYLVVDHVYHNTHSTDSHCYYYLLSPKYYFHLAALLLSVICFLPNLCIVVLLCTNIYFDSDD